MGASFFPLWCWAFSSYGSNYLPSVKVGAAGTTELESTQKNATSGSTFKSKGHSWSKGQKPKKPAYYNYGPTQYQINHKFSFFIIIYMLLGYLRYLAKDPTQSNLAMDPRDLRPRVVSYAGFIGLNLNLAHV